MEVTCGEFYAQLEAYCDSGLTIAIKPALLGQIYFVASGTPRLRPGTIYVSLRVGRKTPTGLYDLDCPLKLKD